MAERIDEPMSRWKDEPMKNSHSSGNGNQMRHLTREDKSSSKSLQARIDTAVKLADREVGIQHSEFSIQNSAGNGPMARSSSGLVAAPTSAVPPLPSPEPISVGD